MNDDDRRRYHLKANDIAEQARRDIEEKLIQSDRVIPAPRPKEGNTPPSLSKEETALKERLLNEANEIKEKAKAEIKRDVLDKLPARATDHDRWLIRRDAHNILDNDYPQYKELTLKDRQISPEFNDMAAQKEREGEVPGRGQERMPQPPSQAEPPQPAAPDQGEKAKRFDRNNVSIFASPKTEGKDKPAPDIPKDASASQKAERFDRSDVSIFASAKTDGPDKTRTPEATKDASAPQKTERFDKNKVSKFLSPEQQAATSKTPPKPRPRGRERDER